jgi:hypothetical protein
MCIIRRITDVLLAVFCADCYVLGHSMGGAVALAAEQICPGTFRSIWVYEPVVSTQLGLAREAERWVSSGATQSARCMRACQCYRASAVLFLQRFMACCLRAQHVSCSHAFAPCMQAAEQQ